MSLVVDRLLDTPPSASLDKLNGEIERSMRVEVQQHDNVIISSRYILFEQTRGTTADLFGQ